MSIYDEAYAALLRQQEALENSKKAKRNALGVKEAELALAQANADLLTAQERLDKRCVRIEPVDENDDVQYIWVDDDWKPKHVLPDPAHALSCPSEALITDAQAQEWVAKNYPGSIWAWWPNGYWHE